MTLFYSYIGLIIVLTAVIVWLVWIAFKEVREYREALKVTAGVFDYCEYFEKTRRLVASVTDGTRDGRMTITGSAKFDEDGRLFAIYTDDERILSPHVLSDRTIESIEAEEAAKREGGEL